MSGLVLGVNDTSNTDTRPGTTFRCAGETCSTASARISHSRTSSSHRHCVAQQLTSNSGNGGKNSTDTAVVTAPTFLTTRGRVWRTPGGQEPKSMATVYTSNTGGGYPTSARRWSGNPATDRRRTNPWTGFYNVCVWLRFCEGTTSPTTQHARQTHLDLQGRACSVLKRNSDVHFGVWTQPTKAGDGSEQCRW